MADTNNVMLGSGELYLNGVNVGYLAGEVQLDCQRKALTFSPSGSSSTELISIGIATLKASLAEFSCNNLRLALGLGGSVNASTGQLSYDPSSYSFATSSTSWEGLTIGRESLGGDTIALQFEHTKLDGKKIVLIFYAAISLSDLSLPFSGDKITMYDVNFMGTPNESRPAGDQVGIIFEEV